MEIGNIAQILSAVASLAAITIAVLSFRKAKRKDAQIAGKSDGYSQRQMEDFESALERSFKYHKEHFDAMKQAAEKAAEDRQALARIEEALLTDRKALASHIRDDDRREAAREKRDEKIDKTLIWMGDTMIRLCAKHGVDIPSRPE